MKFFSSHSIALLGLTAAVAAACGGTATPEPPPGFPGTGGTGNDGTAGAQVGVAGTAVVPMAGSGGSGTMPQPTGCDVVAEVFQASNGCAGGSCHGDGSTNGDFADGVLADFVDVPSGKSDGCFFINSENPELSTIYAWTNGGECAGGLNMPIGGMLDADQKACLLSSIEAAAGVGGDPPGGDNGVGGDPPGGDDEFCDAPTLVFNAAQGGCAGANCHDPGSFYGGFVGANPQDFVNAPSGLQGGDCLFIDSANIEQSMLYTRTVTGGSCGGATMPQGGPTLSQDQAECLLDWLRQFEQ